MLECDKNLLGFCLYETFALLQLNLSCIKQLSQITKHTAGEGKRERERERERVSWHKELVTTKFSGFGSVFWSMAKVRAAPFDMYFNSSCSQAGTTIQGTARGPGLQGPQHGATGLNGTYELMPQLTLLLLP